MARFAPVVPLSVARTMKNAGILGDYHLLLAHDVLEDPIGYAEVYGDPDMTIILDNSIIELGYALKLDVLMEAASVVKPKYVVIPDAMSDMQGTLELTREFLSDFYGMSAEKRHHVTPMGVLQGKNHQELLACAHRMYQDMGVRAFSVPRVVVKNCGSRIGPVLATFGVIGLRTPLHLLGFSDNILDDVCAAKLPCVMGIDSAVPIRAAIRGMRMELGNPFWDPGPRLDYWSTTEMMAEAAMPRISQNVNQFRSWVNEPVATGLNEAPATPVL